MMAKAIALNRADTGAPQGYFCSSCGTVYPRPDEEAKGIADRCCLCRDCGARIDRGWCKPCQEKREAERDAADYAKAKKVPLSEYTGKFVYIDGAGHEGYVAVDSLDDEEREWAWGCTSERAALDLGDAIDSDLHDNHHEDARDWVDWPKVAEAQKLVDEAIKDVESWHEDRSVVVLLGKATT